MSKIYFSNRCQKLFFAAILICICFFNPGIALAQQTISATVKDAGSGKALSGATINVKGSPTNTVSNENGAFTITVPDNSSKLVVSYVGYVSQEIIVGNNTVLEIVLQPNASDLGEVVVVGYGTQNKKDVTGAVKSIKAEAFNKGIVNTPQQLLQGKVSGVNVTSASGEPGGILAITIRGPGGGGAI